MLALNCRYYYLSKINDDPMFPKRPATATIHWMTPSTQNSTLLMCPQSWLLKRKKY